MRYLGWHVVHVPSHWWHWHGVLSHHHRLVHDPRVVAIVHGLLERHGIGTHHGLLGTSWHHRVLLVVGLLLTVVVLAILHALLLALVTTIVVAILVVRLALLVLHLPHQQAQTSDQLNHILVVALHLACLLLVELGAIPLLLLSLLSTFFGLTKVDLESLTTKLEVITLTTSSCRVSIHEADKAYRSLRDQLHGLNFTKVGEESLKFVLGALGVHILDDQVQEMHAPLKVVGALLELLSSLLLGFKLTNHQSLFSVGVEVVRSLRGVLLVIHSIIEVVEGLLRLLRLAETHKAKVLALVVLIALDAQADKLSERREQLSELILSEVITREVLHIEVGGAARFRCTNSVESRHKLAHCQLGLINLISRLDYELMHLRDGLLRGLLRVKLHKAVASGLELRVY